MQRLFGRTNATCSRGMLRGAGQGWRVGWAVWEGGRSGAGLNAREHGSVCVDQGRVSRGCGRRMDGLKKERRRWGRWIVYMCGVCVLYVSVCGEGGGGGDGAV